jgi:adenylosuccinate synthase
MKARVVVISGRVGAGKSSLAQHLRDRVGAELVKTKDLIRKLLPRTGESRRAWQLAGQRLDRKTGGRWVADAVNELIMSVKSPNLLVVDAVRIPEQVRLIRQSGWSVVHVHLEASDTTLERRYSERVATDELPSYSELSRNWTEKHADDLMDLADVVVDTDRCNAEDVFSLEWPQESNLGRS